MITLCVLKLFSQKRLLLMRNSVSPVRVTTCRAIFCYLIVALFLFYEMAVQVSPGVMTAQLMQELSLDPLGLGLMSGFYFYTYTLMQIPSGILFDRIKPRTVICVSLIICACGCLLFAHSHQLYTGSFARLLMGFGSAFAFVAVLVVTADLFPPRYFAFITGITQMLAAFGAMAGQLPLGSAIDHYGWRYIMTVLAVLGVFLALVVWLLLNYEKESLTSAQSQSSPRFTEILRKRQTWVIALYACLLWAPMSGFASLWGVPYLMHVFSLSHSNAALATSMMWLGLALISPILGALSTSWKTRVWPLSLSALAGFVAFAALIFMPQLSVIQLYAVIFFAGAACSGQALSFTVVREINHPDQIGSAIAVNNLAVVVSGAIFQPLIGRILSNYCSTDTAHSLSGCTAAHFQYGMLILLVAYGVAFILALCGIKESFQKSRRETR